MSERSESNGDEGDRTLNPRLAKPVLSQLSYVPELLTPIADRLTHAPPRASDLVICHSDEWAHQDSNLGPRPYQGRALTN